MKPSLGSSDKHEAARACRRHASKGGISLVQEALDRLDCLPNGPDRFGRFTGLAQPMKCPVCGAVTHSEKLKCDGCGHLFDQEDRR